MTQAQMIAAITSSIQTDANLLLALRAAIVGNMNNGNISLVQIQNLCTVLGINYALPPSP